MTGRLDDAALGGLPAAIARPAYRRPALSPGGAPAVVHLGIGAFHRAHQAVYLDDLWGLDGTPWPIAGVSLKRPDARDRLAPQDGLYTLVERAGTPRLRIIGCLRALLVAPEAPAAVLQRLAAPATRLVTLTVTEKGYGLDPATRRLDPADPDIAHDRANPDAPRGAIGYLVAALARIRARGGAPPTLVSCDNLPANGIALRHALVDLAAAHDPALARWIEREVPIPSSMVDRIVPATTADDLAAVQAALGVEDRAAVIAEPFSQWVIENRVGAGFPELGRVGVEMVADVAPHERLKLRVLNASHSALAYLGQLAGLATIADAVVEPVLRAFVERMVAREIAPTLDGFAPAHIADYAAGMLVRFANPAIRHRTAQIAMDGSQKLPQRLLATIEARLGAGASIDLLALAVAAWLHYLRGTDEQGHALAISDPRADRLTVLARGPGAAAVVDAMLRDSGVFSPALAGDARLRRALIGALEGFAVRGVIGTVRAALED